MDQKELAAALKKAKGGTPHRFVLVGKMNAPKLALARTKIPSKLIAELRAETGGSILLQGTCVGEDGDLVFSAAKNAKPSFAPILKKAIKDEAALSIACQVREAGEDEEEEEDSEEASAAQPAAAPRPDAADAKKLAAKLMDLLKSKADKIKQMPEAAAQLRAVKVALDADKLAEAEKMLAALQKALA